MYQVHWILFVSVFVLAHTGKAVPRNDSVLKPEKYVICKNAGIVRSIRVDKMLNEKFTCVVNYTKAGTDERVGSGQSVLGCVSILNKVRENLESHWWSCREAKSISIENFALGKSDGD